MLLVLAPRCNYEYFDDFFEAKIWKFRLERCSLFAQGGGDEIIHWTRSGVDYFFSAEVSSKFLDIDLFTYLPP